MVDFIRRPYRVLARPFKDSEETAEMVWYPALPDAPTLPFPTTFNSLEYQPFPLAKTSPGEVPFVDRHFVEQQPKKHATGKHQCGTPEAFLEGIPYDPEAAVAYNDDGLPVCCSAWERGPCGCSGAGAEVIGPAEGCSCADAIEVEVPSSQVLPPCVLTQHVWVYFDWPAGRTGSLSCVAFGDIKVFRGDDCGNLVQIQFGISYLVRSFTSSDGGRYFVDLTSALEAVGVTLT